MVKKSREELSVRFQERGPGSALSCWDGLNAQREEAEEV